MEHHAIEVAVVGAGVVGLAVAAELARRGREVILLEQTGAIGSGTSSRNSEVIHAGLYYPPESLKAKACVAGRKRLYDFCDSHQVAYQKCGKLIVATEAGEVAGLEAIASNARASGVPEVEMWSAAQVAAAEPALSCVAALHSPETGIVDCHGFMLALQGELEANSGMIAFHAPVEGGQCQSRGPTLRTGGTEPMGLDVRWLINAAGLDAQQVTRSFAGFPTEMIPPRFLAKGSYFSLTGRSPVKRLVYPAPSEGGLGTHLTIDLAGQARFGPDVEWVSAIDYSVDATRADGFYAMVRRYWPDLPDGALEPGYAGIRPKLVGPGHPAADFLIQAPATHGCPGIVNLFGIESPGLTSSLALADHVADIVDRG